MLNVVVYELDVGSETWSNEPGVVRRFVAVWEDPHLGRFIGRGSSRQEAIGDLVVGIQAYMREHKILSLEYTQLDAQLKEPEPVERPTRFDRDNVI